MRDIVLKLTREKLLDCLLSDYKYGNIYLYINFVTLYYILLHYIVILIEHFNKLF